MQHVMWVHQRQLSYLLYIIVFTLFHTCRNLNSNFILAFTLPHSHCNSRIKHSLTFLQSPGKDMLNNKYFVSLYMMNKLYICT